MTIHTKGSLTVKDVANMTGGSLIGFSDSAILQITTDSREIGEGALFIAIRGERFDGNDYVNAAISGGATCVLCERLPANFSGCAVAVCIGVGRVFELLWYKHVRVFCRHA